VSLSGQAKIKLTVDIQGGKLMTIKPTKNVLNDNNVFSHDKSMPQLFRNYISVTVILVCIQLYCAVNAIDRGAKPHRRLNEKELS